MRTRHEHHMNGVEARTTAIELGRSEEPKEIKGNGSDFEIVEREQYIAGPRKLACQHSPQRSRNCRRGTEGSACK